MLTRDEIIRMANKAGVSVSSFNGLCWVLYVEDLQRFAALTYEAGAKAEREECAKEREELEWQPIETAPKEKNVLLFGGWVTTNKSELSWFNEGCVASQSDQGCWYLAGAFPYYTVTSGTHWMPLPPPPKNMGAQMNSKLVGELTRDDIDTLWQQALREAVQSGEMYTRYHFAALVIEAERDRICKAIKEEDDYCVTQGDYMLDSDDCIAVAKGEWVRPDYNAVFKQGELND